LVLPFFSVEFLLQIHGGLADHRFERDIKEDIRGNLIKLAELSEGVDWGA
jgi:hypothetical protein